jgi:hypothetical protein
MVYIPVTYQAGAYYSMKETSGNRAGALKNIVEKILAGIVCVRSRRPKQALSEIH